MWCIISSFSCQLQGLLPFPSSFPFPYSLLLVIFSFTFPFQGLQVGLPRLLQLLSWQQFRDQQCIQLRIYKPKVPHLLRLLLRLILHHLLVLLLPPQRLRQRLFCEASFPNGSTCLQPFLYQLQWPLLHHRLTHLIPNRMIRSQCSQFSKAYRPILRFCRCCQLEQSHHEQQQILGKLQLFFQSRTQHQSRSPIHQPLLHSWLLPPGFLGRMPQQRPRFHQQLQQLSGGQSLDQSFQLRLQDQYQCGHCRVLARIQPKRSRL